MKKYLLIIEEDVFETKHLWQLMSALDIESVDSNDGVYIIGIECTEDVAYEFDAFDYVDEIIEV